MKLIFSVFALVLSLTLCAQIPEAPAQGTGTPSDPFHIANFGNLFWMAQTPGVWNQHFVQTADIDASDSALISSPEPNTAGWIPIGNGSTTFSGSYDGQGYGIYNLFLHRPTMSYTGLFGYMNGAKLNRINLRTVYILGQTYTGGLAGVANYGSVVNNCSVTGSVTGVTNVGGLLGYCDGSGTTNSYSHANVSGTGDQVGGFVGLSGWNNSSYHQFCYSTGSVTAPNAAYKGGFLGRSSSVTLRDCYWDLQTSGMATDPLAIGKSTAQMKQQATYTRWNFQNQWSIAENFSYPDLDGLLFHAPPTALTLDDLMGSGTASDPYLLMNAAQLNVMRQNLNTHYALGADIDLNSSVVWNLGSGWEPVGGQANPFTGSFEGNGYTIDGLSISRPKSDLQGLFGYTDGASIRRLSLSNCHILAQSNVGGAVGYSKNSSVDEISFDGIMLAHSASGGIAGVVENGYVQRSRSEIDLKNYSNYAGGLVGYIISSGSINGTVSNSSCTGAVSGTHNVGGLVGMVAWGYILNSYSHSTVNGTYQVGGLVGTMGWDNPGHVARCFSTGLINPNPGSDYVGGLIGRAQNGYFLECYWDTQSSGMTSSSGLGASGKTTVEMMQQSTFLRWNFSTLWQMGSRGYPTHQDLSIYALPLALTTDDLLGYGTPELPYVIQTIDELNVMRQVPDAYYINNDLDLSATCVWNGGKGWEPVGTSAAPYTGSLDGYGHQLSHLFIEWPDNSYSGLFGYISGSSISDIVLTDVSLHARNYLGSVAGYAVDSRIDMIDLQGTISGNDTVGGIAGQVVRSIIQRCKTYVTCWADNYHAGGIVAIVSSDASFNSTVSTCEASGSVRSNSNTGGLVGFLAYGSLINSASHATVQGYTQNGGAVGTCGWDNPGSIVRSYSTGMIVSEAGGYSNYGLVGRYQNGQIYDCYWDTSSSGTNNGGPTNAIGLSTAAMQQQASYQNWNFDTLWQISEGTDYPRLRDLSIYEDPSPVALNQMMGVGTADEPYLIQNPSELNAIRQNLSAHYQILYDLDLSATLIWNGGRGWQPIGSLAEPFTGSIDGNAKTIQGLNIFAPLTNNVGFISKTHNGSISNLKLSSVSLVLEDNGGALAGGGETCTLSGVSAQSQISGNAALGGLIGVLSGGSVQACSASPNILARGSYLGGLFGTVNTEAQISLCSSSGSLKGYTAVGGICGELYQGTVSDSYSHTAVEGYSDIGGAVGRIGWDQSGHLLRSYSTGAVTLTPGAYYFGGLVGRLFSGTIQACYWDMDTSGMSSSSGTGATGLSTAQMTWPGSWDHFGTWDFIDTWRHDSTSLQNTGYPYLAWQEVPVPDAVQNLVILASSGQFTLQWQAVDGVSLYKVYTSENPYAPLNQWSYIGQSAGTSMVVSGGDKRFFIVRSVGMERR